MTRDEEPATRVRIDVLARGDDDTKAWLARVDAAGGDAYRGDALPLEELRDLVASEEQAVDVRVAAARVLARRHGEARDAVAGITRDSEVRARVEAALDDDADRAAARLDAVGPLFRHGR